MPRNGDISDFGLLNNADLDALELIEQRSKQGKAIPLFVYGTLRVGEALYSYYNSGVVKERHEATSPGVLYFPFHYQFPGARFDEEGTIIGDILWYPLSAASLLEVITMELRAGYSLVKVNVTYERKTGRPHRKEIEALAFQHNYSDSSCERVPGGDWKSVAARAIHGRGVG